eukprot:107248-Prymnesium_polylepis.1
MCVWLHVAVVARGRRVGAQSTVRRRQRGGGDWSAAKRHLEYQWESVRSVGGRRSVEVECDG